MTYAACDVALRVAGIAFAMVTLAFAQVGWITVNRGRVLTGLRDDERRIAVAGLSPYRVKLLAFVVSGTLAGLGGATCTLVVGGAAPHLASADLTLSLIVMAVLSGAGTRWGALAGGILYAYLDQRLARVGGQLPGPLGQPLFVLGTLFVLAVYLAPGGLAGLRRWIAPLRRAIAAPGR